jgi:Family of unknown function (DUF6503)
MKNNKLLILVFLSLMSNAIVAQKIIDFTAKDVLNQCINFHDPKGNWGNLHQKLYFHAKEPDNDNIREEVLLDNRVTYFCHISRADSNVIEKEISDTTIVARINGDTAISAENRKKYRLMPRQIRSARNSYVFLYGLPMKLRDSGTILSDTVRMDTFNGKNYLVLNVKYEKGVGNDTWFFYIDPTTYALEGYRFNHNRKPNDGEFIICQDLIEVDGVRMPKVRLWHDNETKKYMATDILDKVEDWIGKKD